MKRYALFVGINEYKDQSISRLRCAGNDAKALYTQFVKSGFETSLLLNNEASCCRVADELKKIMEKISKGDLFVFYFAGHGILHNETHHLVAADADINFKTCILSVQNLLDHIGAEKGIHRMFILDCCRADLQHGRGDSYSGDFSRRISLTGETNGNGGFSPYITLNSCSHKEKAYEDIDHGYFTKALLNTIQDETIRDFNDFQAKLQANMISPHPQHIDWSGQLDFWKHVKLFPTWEKTFISSGSISENVAPDEYYAMVVDAEHLEQYLEEKKLKVSQSVEDLRRMATLAADHGDFATAVKKLQEYIAQVEKIIDEQKKQIEKASKVLLLSADGKTVTGVSDNTVTHIVIPSDVTTIGDYAFYNCSKLVYVSFPAGVTYVGRNAFSGCTALKRVELPTECQYCNNGAKSTFPKKCAVVCQKTSEDVSDGKGSKKIKYYLAYWLMPVVMAWITYFIMCLDGFFAILGFVMTFFTLPAADFVNNYIVREKFDLYDNIRAFYCKILSVVRLSLAWFSVLLLGNEVTVWGFLTFVTLGAIMYSSGLDMMIAMRMKRLSK